VTLYRDRPAGSSARNLWRCEVAGLETHGDRIRADLTGELPLAADLTTVAAAELGLHPGPWCGRRSRRSRRTPTPPEPGTYRPSSGTRTPPASTAGAAPVLDALPHARPGCDDANPRFWPPAAFRGFGTVPGTEVWSPP
jgi:hypothetical protein